MAAEQRLRPVDPPIVRVVAQDRAYLVTLQLRGRSYVLATSRSRDRAFEIARNIEGHAALVGIRVRFEP